MVKTFASSTKPIPVLGKLGELKIFISSAIKKKIGYEKVDSKQKHVIQMKKGRRKAREI